jgi:hypothetical protein
MQVNGRTAGTQMLTMTTDVPVGPPPPPRPGGGGGRAPPPPPAAAARPRRHQRGSPSGAR